MNIRRPSLRERLRGNGSAQGALLPATAAAGSP